jgi:hypothetical protein
VAGALETAAADDAGVDAAGALDAGALELAAVAGLLTAAAGAEAAAEGDEDELLDELLHPTIASAAALAAVNPMKKRRAIKTALCVP